MNITRTRSIRHASKRAKLVFGVLGVVAATTLMVTAVAAQSGQRFPDVPPGHEAYAAVEWAAAAGLTLGYDDGTFRPDEPLPRWAAVVFMERFYDDILGADASGGFTRGDMMVLLKAINDSSPPPPEPQGPEPSTAAVSMDGVSLQVAPERDSGYDRDDWGPHNSDLCRGAVGSADPYTGTRIDACDVDHVVALREAHESGGWAWSGAEKRHFSQDPANHVASRACVNRSKGGDDISEWSDADIARSSACGGGYTVTAAGRCLMARITVAVKTARGLTVDRAEADALARTLAGCGDQAPGSSTEPSDPAPTPQTDTPVEGCEIAGTAAQYDAVPGIGPTLAARLVAAQPFTSREQLEAVRGIGPAKAEAVWSHFCRAQ